MWFFVQQDNRGLGNFLCSKYLHLFLDDDAIDETTTSTIGDESIITAIAPFEKEPRSNWRGGRDARGHDSKWGGGTPSLVAVRTTTMWSSRLTTRNTIWYKFINVIIYVMLILSRPPLLPANSMKYQLKSQSLLCFATMCFFGEERKFPSSPSHCKNY
jgi:hypothetical protein